jgi:protein-disulfide isomerase
MVRRRNLFIVAAALGAVGVVLSALLTRQHAAAHAGLASACNVNAFINCDRVATSAWSVFLGLPVAVWGLLGYGLITITATLGLRTLRPGSWPAGVLFALAAVAASVSVGLAALSELAIGALCLYCAGSWLVALALLPVAWRACRPEGVAAAIRSDLSLVAARPLLTFGTLVAMGILVAIAARSQPRYWEKPAPSAVVPVATAAPFAGQPLVVEFSDYECPFCAKAHDDLKALVASRPDVKVVKRHFPLDASCNPLMQRTLHPDACRLALAAICAERQGRFDEMDDALFRNQQAKRPVEELAAGIGLDVAAFRKCLVDPASARRLSSDIATGIQIGLKATPTYVVNGVQYTGTLPAGALPPPASASR